MLISFIVKRWAVIECGSPTPPPTPLGNKTIRYQLLKFDDVRVHLLAPWKMGVPVNDVDEGQDVQWEDARVEGEEFRIYLPVIAYGSRDDVREDQDL
ncbi:hypothetical protein LIER_44148 [Lithospermum erythrorhizon]|uniref:Uncharacterized protein n=1 Tax=Lithospermum erythrorhizon TaxID=34254 RepID=A0AAV3QJG6_LITER